MHLINYFQLHFLCTLRANSHYPNKPMYPNISRMFSTNKKNQLITSPWINLSSLFPRELRMFSFLI